MDFQPQPGPPPPVPPVSAHRPAARGNNRLTFIALWAALVIVLVIGLVLYASQKHQIQSVKDQVNATKAQLTAQQSSEFKDVDNSKFQAVFLSSGQVYFGKIVAMNPQYLKLTDIFYLQNVNGNAIQQTNAAGAATSLVKLGCELHAPYDSMVVQLNRVDFWENLQSNGQVTQAIEKFNAGNPGGQKCPA